MKSIRLLASKVIEHVRRPFSWFTWENLFDTPAEWHAFVEGLADGFCLIPSRYKLWDEGEGDINLLESLRREHHYYNAGRAIGFAILIVFVSVMVRWIVISAIRALPHGEMYIPPL